MPALSFHYVLLELGVGRKYNNIGVTHSSATIENTLFEDGDGN